MKAVRPLASALILITLAAAPAPAQTANKLIRHHLDQNTTLQGYPCARGYVWTFRNGRLDQCAVSRDITFGQLAIPAGSIVVLRSDGAPHHVFLAHDAWIGPWHIRGGSFLGPGEGAITGLYPTGQLRSFYLVADQTIQGVPCRGGEWGIVTDPINGGNFVLLYPSGKLHSCKLTADYQGTPSGHRITLPE